MLIIIDYSPLSKFTLTFQQRETVEKMQVAAMSKPALSPTDKSESPKADEKEVLADLITTISTSDDKVLYTAMVNLEEMLKEQEGRLEKQEVFLRLGGPLAVVTTMLKLPHNKAVQEWGLVTLVDAADGNSSIQGVAIDVGAIRAILQAMANHPSSRSVQEGGLTALYKLCSSKPHAQSLATKFGGVPLIISAMETFSDDEELVLMGSQLLDRLSEVVRSQQLMIDAKVLSALSTIVQTYRQNKNILTYAGRTMIRLIAV